MPEDSARIENSVTPAGWPEDVRQKAAEVMSKLLAPEAPKREYDFDQDSSVVRIMGKGKGDAVVGVACFTLETVRKTSVDQLYLDTLKGQTDLIAERDISGEVFELRGQAR